MDPRSAAALILAWVSFGCHVAPLEPARVLAQLREMPPPPPAQLPEKLSADEAVALAVARHPSLAEWREAQGIAESEVKMATEIANPSLRITKTDLNLPDRSGWQIGLRWDPPRPWQLMAKRDAALAQVAGAEADLSEEVLKLGIEVRREHATAASLMREVNLAQQLVQERAGALDSIEKKVSLGAATRIQVESSKAGLAQAKNIEADISSQLQLCMQRLRGLFVLSKDVTFEISETEKATGFALAQKELEEAALKNRGLLHSTEAKYAGQVEVVRMAKLDRLPWFRITAGPRLGVMPVAERTWLDLGIEIYFPVWNWNTARIAAEEHRLLRERERFTAQLSSLRSGIENAAMAFESCQQSMKRFDSQLLPALESKVAAAKEAATQGQIDSLVVLSAEDAVFAAKRTQEHNRLECHLAALELQRLIGTSTNTSAGK
jgi:outer membrane protein, heavy metal efflux system